METDRSSVHRHSSRIVSLIVGTAILRDHNLDLFGVPVTVVYVELTIWACSGPRDLDELLNIVC